MTSTKEDVFIVWSHLSNHEASAPSLGAHLSARVEQLQVTYPQALVP